MGRLFWFLVCFCLPASVFGFSQPADIGNSLKIVKDPSYKYLEETSPTSWKVSLLLQGFSVAQEVAVTVDKGVITVSSAVKVVDQKPSLRLETFLGSLNASSNLWGYFTVVPQSPRWAVVYQSKQKLEFASQNSLVAALADAAGMAYQFWETTLSKNQ